jgi:ATP-dependent DNA helicase RecG
MLNYDIFFREVTIIPRVSEEIAHCLERLDIKNIRDLVFYKPHSYQVKDLSPNLSKLQDGQFIQTEIIIRDMVISTSKRMPTKILGSNDSGSILLVFFNKIPTFILNKLKIGSKHIVSGKVQFFDYYFQMPHPEFIFNKKLESAIEPLYYLTYGIVNKQLYSYILSGLELLDNHFAHSHNPYINSLLNNLKILHLHMPSLHPSKVNESWNRAIIALAEKELIANQLFLQNLRKHTHRKNGRSFKPANSIKMSILNKLNFQLTTDQKLVIKEIEQDQKSPMQMMRLLQGDVGSGKTLVALLTMVNVTEEGFQSTLMAPTDLLANQHYLFYQRALEGSNIKVALLTGKTSQKERKKIAEELENGEIKILIGTHALFQEKVSFKDLAYIIIDEQHRFGVEQRLNLINKASHPDVLVMTATPIPRSLALTMFGDMAISKLKSKPKNRLPITTKVISIHKIDKVIEAINKKINCGEKIYWICPLIDQNDQFENAESDYEKQSLNEDPRLSHSELSAATPNKSTSLSDVTNRYEELAGVFKGKVAIMHGKMKQEEKDHVMQQFRNGEIYLLISTTVIEVGIDVPDATLIIIEDAQQFGLAQLHQLRGRVGRGNIKSYCIMLYNPKRLSLLAKKRFEVMKESNDGFYIAEQDLLLRGSGEVLGTKQSGEPKFFFADLTRDLEALIKAHNLSQDYQLSDFTSFQIKLFTKEQNSVI